MRLRMDSDLCKHELSQFPLAGDAQLLVDDLNGIRNGARGGNMYAAISLADQPRLYSIAMVNSVVVRLSATSCLEIRLWILRQPALKE